MSAILLSELPRGLGGERDGVRRSCDMCLERRVTSMSLAFLSFRQLPAILGIAVDEAPPLLVLPLFKLRSLSRLECLVAIIRLSSRSVALAEANSAAVTKRPTVRREGRRRSRQREIFSDVSWDWLTAWNGERNFPKVETDPSYKRCTIWLYGSTVDESCVSCNGAHK